MSRRGKLTLAQKVVNMLLPEKSRIVFETPLRNGRKVTGYEAEVILEISNLYNQQGFTYEEETYWPTTQYQGYLLVYDAARRYGLRPSILQQLCREKIIRCDKIGGRWVIYQYSLESYLSRLRE